MMSQVDEGGVTERGPTAGEVVPQAALTSVCAQSPLHSRRNVTALCLQAPSLAPQAFVRVLGEP